MNIGGRLKILRDSLGMKNQTQFAEKLGITQTSLSKYENGTVDIPDDVKIKMGEFGVNLHWLLTGNGEMFMPELGKTVSRSSLAAELGVLLDQKLEKIEAQIVEIENRLQKVELPPTKALDSGLYTMESEPEYGNAQEKVPFVDNIAAGPPIQQSEDLSIFIGVPERFIKTKAEDYYAARIRGESMTAVGIPDGCTVLIHRSDVPRDGAIQVVRCGRKSTLKRMREGEDHTWTLRYEDNSGRYIPIAKDEEYQVQGDFVAVLPEDK